MRISRPTAVLLCGLVTFTLGPTVGAVDAEAQGRRAVRRPAGSRPAARRGVRPRGRVVYSGGYGYRPYAYGYDPLFYGPYSYPYPYYGGRYDHLGSVRLQVKPADSTGQCNSVSEYIRRRSITECLAWPRVERACDLV